MGLLGHLFSDVMPNLPITHRNPRGLFLICSFIFHNDKLQKINITVKSFNLIKVLLFENVICIQVSDNQIHH